MALTNRRAIEVISVLHRLLYKATGGVIGARLGGFPMLLLTTTGRKSGQQRTTPLLYMDDGPNRVVVASNGGADWHPAWWLNLQAKPDGTIQIGGQTTRVRAREAREDERDVLWNKVIALNPDFAEYRKRTSRSIPLVILEPAAAE